MFSDLERCLFWWWFFYSHFVFLSACLSCKPSTLVKDILISADLRTGDRHLIKTVVIKLKGHEGSPVSLRFIRNSQIWCTSYQIPWNNMVNLQTTPIVNKPLFEVNKKMEKKLDSHKILYILWPPVSSVTLGLASHDLNARHCNGLFRCNHV